MWFQQTFILITTAVLLVNSIKTLGENLNEAYPFLQVKTGTHDTKTSLSYGSVVEHLFQAANPAPILSSTGNKSGVSLVCHRIRTSDYKIHLKKFQCKSAVFKAI